MKGRAALVPFGLIAGAGIFCAFMLFAGFRSTPPASIAFVGYSRTATSSLAVFQVTNRSRAAFCCAIGAREHGGIRDAVVRAVPACGAVEVSVPLPTDTKVWRFKVRLDELRSVPDWQSRMRLALARIGIRIPRGRTYEIVTPSLPELKIEAAVEQREPLSSANPFRFE